MAGVPLPDFLQYAGGDADATFRLAQRLVPEALRDEPTRRACRVIYLKHGAARTYGKKGRIAEEIIPLIIRRRINEFSPGNLYIDIA